MLLDYVLISPEGSNDLPHSLCSFVRTTIIVFKYTPQIFKYFCLKNHTSSNDSVFLLYSKKCLQKDLYSYENEDHTTQNGDIHLETGTD